MSQDFTSAGARWGIAGRESRSGIIRRHGIAGNDWNRLGGKVAKIQWILMSQMMHLRTGIADLASWRIYQRALKRERWGSRCSYSLSGRQSAHQACSCVLRENLGFSSTSRLVAMFCCTFFYHVVYDAAFFCRNNFDFGSFLRILESQLSLLVSIFRFVH